MKKHALFFSPALLAILCAAYWWWLRPTPVDAKDMLLLTDFVNHSGDPVFDDSLGVALRVALAQSPFLNLISDQKARQAMKRLGKSDREPLTEPVARAICSSVGAKAYLNGIVSKDRAGYTIDLIVHRCPDGARMARGGGHARGMISSFIT